MNRLNVSKRNQQHGRRDFFKQMLAGSGVGASASPQQDSLTSSAQMALHWINASRAHIGKNLESDIFENGIRTVRGLSYSNLAIHIDVPLAVGSVLHAVWLRLEAQAGAKLQKICVFDCEHEITRIEQVSLQAPAWSDVRLRLPQACTVQRSLSLRIECAFDGTERQLGIAAIGYEFLETRI